MAEKELEADDPYELVNVRFPFEPGVDGDEVMARVFIEEYALMGMPRQKLLNLFRSPYFAGTHAILANRGEGFVHRLVDEVYGPEAQEVS
ncbi:MAG: hypothetical protein IT304_05255 [Dehalococcoidia bacterium]|nr:hypothetical protein [Dehalococcoidia bacterium]